ncbi:metallophosphoesterase family protein [Halorientalis halophila]|uniref:metallophosphoesterase family protein n=1 Tax=Halorientalis halophila TaxID=3108499 RepID=UPI00300A41FA
MFYRSAPGPTLARLDGPTASRPTSLAVLADPHVTARGRGTWRVLHRTVQRARTAVTEANRLDVDGVVVAGDLTDGGAPHEFDRADALLAGADAPTLAVPGDHDVSGAGDDPGSAPATAFADRFADGRYPFVARIGGIDLVGIDTASGVATDGAAGVSAPQLDWLESILPGLERPVVVCHHPLADLDEAGTDAPGSRIENAQELARVLRDGGVELVLSGHRHWPGTGTIGGVREIVAPAVCSLPQAFLHLRIDAEGAIVDLIPLAERTGFEEAYAHARDDGRWLAERVDDGGLARFPLVDERSEPTAAADKRVTPGP